MYSGIFVVVAGILTGVLITGLRSQSRQNAANEVSQQLDLVLSTVQRLVREGSLIESVYEGTSTSTPCSTYCTLRLRTNASSTDPTIISSDANGVYLKEGSGATTTLTTSRIRVDYLRFTQFGIAAGHDVVNIDASFTYLSDQPALAVTKTLQSAISRVSAATFDSDLVPNADNTWSIGQVSPNLRWKDGRFAGNVTVEGNVGIGTTSPSTKLHIIETTANNPDLRMENNQNAAGKNAFISAYVGGASAGDPIFRAVVPGGTSWALGVRNTDGDKFYINSYSDLSTNTRFVIDTSGNVGIGTASPQAKLQLDVTTTPSQIIRRTSDNSYASIKLVSSATGVDGEQGRLYLDASANLFGFQVGTSDAGVTSPLLVSLSAPNNAVRIDNNGNVGIGTSTPATNLHIVGTTGNVGGITLQTSDADGMDVIFRNSASDYFAIDTYGADPEFRILSVSNGVAYGRISILASTGRVGVKRVPTANDFEVEGTASKSTAGDWLANSDARIKTDIAPAEGLSLLTKLRPVKFRYTDEYLAMHPEIENRVYYNFIAQEFAQVFPDYVQGSGEYLSDGSEILQLDSYAANVVAIRAIQELNEKVDAFLGTVKDAVVRVKELAADAIRARVVRVDYTEYVDRATGDIYCTWIENGEFVKEKGECR